MSTMFTSHITCLNGMLLWKIIMKVVCTPEKEKVASLLLLYLYISTNVDDCE